MGQGEEGRGLEGVIRAWGEVRGYASPSRNFLSGVVLIYVWPGGLGGVGCRCEGPRDTFIPLS